MKSEKPSALTSLKIPVHIAIIMDGNGRWAKRNIFNRLRGHRRGAEVVPKIVTACHELGVKHLTLYSFSEENWHRPQTEVSALMKLLKEFLISQRPLLLEKKVRLRAIGNLDRLPSDARLVLDETMELTRNHQSMDLILALSYGGRDEITRAVRKISTLVAQGTLDPQSISSETITHQLDTAGIPDPDLLIRTSGEMRTSNFLPWQLVYTEMVVTPLLWPEFTSQELHHAIEEFNQRERRFGLTSEQLVASGAV